VRRLRLRPDPHQPWEEDAAALGPTGDPSKTVGPGNRYRGFESPSAWLQDFLEAEPG